MKPEILHFRWRIVYWFGAQTLRSFPGQFFSFKTLTFLLLITLTWWLLSHFKTSMSFFSIKLPTYLQLYPYTLSSFFLELNYMLFLRPKLSVIHKTQSTPFHVLRATGLKSTPFHVLSNPTLLLWFNNSPISKCIINFFTIYVQVTTHSSCPLFREKLIESVVYIIFLLILLPPFTLELTKQCFINIQRAATLL